MFEVDFLYILDFNCFVVLFHDMAFSSERKRDGRNQQTSGRGTERHFPQSGFESTEWEVAENCSYRCVRRADDTGASDHADRGDYRSLDRRVSNLPLGVAG